TTSGGTIVNIRRLFPTGEAEWLFCPGRKGNLVEIEFFAIHPVQLAGYFRTVGGSDLLHDVMDVSLHGTFAHAKLNSDNLVRFAQPDRMDNLDLACGEQFSQNVVVNICGRGLKNHGSGHVHAARGGKMNSLDTDFYIDRGGNIAASADFHGAHDLRPLLAFSEENHRHRTPKLDHSLQFFREKRVRQPF